MSDKQIRRRLIMNKDNWLRPSAESIKIAMLRQAAGMDRFGVNPVFIHGMEYGGPVHAMYRLTRIGVRKLTGTEYHEQFETEETPLSKGGTIVLGLTMDLDDRELLERVETYLPDLIKEAVSDVMEKDIGWTIGKLGHGHYVSPQGEHFDERSTTVTIRGVDSDTLRRIGNSIISQMGQFAVLVVDDNENRSYMLSRKTETEEKKL